jgi:hypothetical protein
MATFNVEDAAFAGAGVLSRKPVAVLVWALLWAALIILVTAPFIGMVASFISLAARNGGSPDPATLLPIAGGLIAWGLLLWLGGLCLGAVVQSAVIRAVLRPEDDAMAYIRFGSEEVHVLTVNFVKGVVLFVIRLVVGMVVLIVAGVAAMSGARANTLVSGIGNLCSAILMAWITLRLSLAAPMSFSERKFRLFESWTMTSGMNWRLWGVGIIVGVLVVVIYLLAMCIGVIGAFSIWSGGPRLAEIQNLFAQPPSQWEAVLAPYFALMGLVALVAGALITPIAFAPWPYIYRSLTATAEPEPVET